LLTPEGHGSGLQTMACEKKRLETIAPQAAANLGVASSCFQNNFRPGFKTGRLFGLIG